MAQQIRSIGPVSFAKVMAVLYGAIGVVIGVFVALIILFGALAGAPPAVGFGRGGTIQFLLGVGSILFFPVCYALIGALFGLVGAALYNVVAKHIGGVEVEIG